MIDDKLASLGSLRLSGTSKHAIAFFIFYESFRLLLPAVLLGISIIIPF